MRSASLLDEGAGPLRGVAGRLAARRRGGRGPPPPLVSSHRIFRAPLLVRRAPGATGPWAWSSRDPGVLSVLGPVHSFSTGPSPGPGTRRRRRDGVAPPGRARPDGHRQGHLRDRAQRQDDPRRARGSLPRAIASPSGRRPTVVLTGIDDPGRSGEPVDAPRARDLSPTQKRSSSDGRTGQAWPGRARWQGDRRDPGQTRTGRRSRRRNPGSRHAELLHGDEEILLEGLHPVLARVLRAAPPRGGPLTAGRVSAGK